MPHSTIFQLYRGGQFIGGGNRNTLGKTTTLMVIGTDGIYR